MAYVEFIRARRVLLWFGVTAVVLLGLNLALALATATGHAKVDIEGGPKHIPLSVVLVLAGLITAIVATVLGSGLSSHAQRFALVWTFPQRRERSAWVTLGVDAVAIVIAFALALAFVCLIFAAYGQLGGIVFDGDAPWRLPLAIGAAFLFYAFIQLCSARSPGRGGLIAGLSWPAFIVIAIVRLAFEHRSPAIALALTLINPLTYFEFQTGTDGHASTPGMTLPVDLQTAIVWVLVLAASAAAVALWSRQEA